MSIPLATYRIQFNPSFGFRHMTEVIPYLAELGISHVYASPIFRARKGSTHGYDIVDPNLLNPELGTEEDFELMFRQLRLSGMGWLQDVVPNHMAFDYQNERLTDVLENGRRSQYTSFFDVDWEHAQESLKNRVLAPFLAKFFGESLEEGAITLSYGLEGLTIHYEDLAFPLAMDSYSMVLSHRLASLRRKLGDEHSDFIKLLGILYVLRTLGSDETETHTYDQVRFVKRMLWDLYSTNREFKEFLDTNIRMFNGEKGDSESFNALEALLSKQVFRLSYWKIATKEINYRRFFNINGLVSVRVQEESVFQQTHRLIAALIREGKVNGLRIDHVDGLFDPLQYLNRIRTILPEGYLLVEKILGQDEDLPGSWPVDGTTGYDFLNYCNGLFCNRRNQRALTRTYSPFLSSRLGFEHLLADNKRIVILEDMAGDVNNLVYELKAISSRDRHGADITLYGLRRALMEVLAAFPVYRTYIDAGGSATDDLKYIGLAVEKAMAANPGLLPELSFIDRFLRLDYPPHFNEELRKDWVKTVMRFQQYTGPLMAKGFEDTTLYVYNRLVSLNEVGGNPARFGHSPGSVHRFLARRRDRWPHSMNATSTHDTKRGEDVRARINVVSEMPSAWEKNVKAWHELNKPKRMRVRGRPVPDRNDEYFLYQTLVGAWPSDESDYRLFVDRIMTYAIKAVREAKVHTAWIRPDTEYEDAYCRFLESILNPTEDNVFLQEIKEFAHKIAEVGMANSLSQVLIKMTAPGIPDFYQGSELWDLNLVDPDNRRPVDFVKRRDFLAEIRQKSDSDLADLIRDLVERRQDGRIKLFLIWKALGLRTLAPELFADGDYVPLELSGRLRDHVFAFARCRGDMWAVTVAPRLASSLVSGGGLPVGEGVWSGTDLVLPAQCPRHWRNVITDEALFTDGDALAVGKVLRHFPVALLAAGIDA